MNVFFMKTGHGSIIIIIVWEKKAFNLFGHNFWGRLKLLFCALPTPSPLLLTLSLLPYFLK